MSQYEDLSMDVQYTPKGVMQWPGPVTQHWGGGAKGIHQMVS